MGQLFPFFGDHVQEDTVEELPLYKEVAWDFIHNIPLLKNGDYEIVTGNLAIETWAYKALKTVRYRWEIYSTDFGSEIDNLIGESYTPNLTKAECVRYIEEALLINPYIRSISNVQVGFEKGFLTVVGDMETVYGKTALEVWV